MAADETSKAQDESIDELRDRLTHTADPIEQAWLIDGIALTLARNGRPAEALVEFTRAVALREPTAGPDWQATLLYAASLANLGKCYVVLERYAEAIPSLARALEIYEGLVGSDALPLVRYADIALTLGGVLTFVGQNAMGARVLGLAAAAYETLLERDRDRMRASWSQLREALDGLDSAATALLDAPPDAERLERIAHPSSRVAFRLLAIAEYQHDKGELAPAVRTAIQATRYVELFQTQNEALGLVKSRSLVNLAQWSARLEAGDASARAAAEILSTGRTAASTADAEPTDRRRWSCTGRDLSLLIGDLLNRRIPGSNVHDLAKQFRSRHIYPARDYAHRMSARPPDIFITYDWRKNFIDLQVAVRSGLSYVAKLILERRPNLEPEAVERMVNEELGVWIDFLFIDQNARDISAEVRQVLPAVIDSAKLHFVLSKTALLRSWCCYEVALFNRRSPTEPGDQRTLRSFIAPTQLNYQWFERTMTSMPEDKAVIERYLREEYPGGMPAVESMLKQASMLSDPFVTSGIFSQFAAAEQLVEFALDEWIARSAVLPKTGSALDGSEQRGPRTKETRWIAAMLRGPAMKRV